MVAEDAPTACKICVSVIDESVDNAILTAQTAAHIADVIEIRLDMLTKPQVAPFIEKLSTPLLFTNRAAWEGGHCKLPEDQRLALLQDAADLGASYIDVELHTDETLQKKLISAAKEKGAKVIVSWHNFTDTPTTQELISILQLQFRANADIGKIVCMAHNHFDVLRVLDLQVQAAELGFPLIAFSMGRPGMISRIATMELGGFMTYTAPARDRETAPGQLPLHIMQTIRETLNNAV